MTTSMFPGILPAKWNPSDEEEFIVAALGVRTSARETEALIVGEDGDLLYVPATEVTIQLGREWFRE